MLKSEKNFLAMTPLHVPNEAPHTKTSVKFFPNDLCLMFFFGDTRYLLESFGIEKPWQEIFSQMSMIIPLLYVRQYFPRGIT